MAITLFFPYTAIFSNGQKVSLQAYTAESLPLTPDPKETTLVLTKQIGIYGPGVYQWFNNKWQFVLSYENVFNELFGITKIYIATPNSGDNLIPVGDSGQAIVSVYRNGGVLAPSAYDIVTEGISLKSPTNTGEVYVVKQASPITPTTIIPSGGSGIPDAPINGLAYVRKNGAWEDISSELNEGSFTGN